MIMNAPDNTKPNCIQRLNKHQCTLIQCEAGCSSIIALHFVNKHREEEEVQHNAVQTAEPNYI